MILKVLVVCVCAVIDNDNHRSVKDPAASRDDTRNMADASDSNMLDRRIKFKLRSSLDRVSDVLALITQYLKGPPFRIARKRAVPKSTHNPLYK